MTVTDNNDEGAEISIRVPKGDRSAGALNDFLGSKKVLRPAVLYEYELGALKQSDQKKLEIWDRKILRMIYGKNGRWSININIIIKALFILQTLLYIMH